MQGSLKVFIGKTWKGKSLFHCFGALNFLCSVAYTLISWSLAIGEVLLKKEEIESVALMLRELGLSYKETAKVMRELTRELQHSRHLWKKDNGSKLVKVGLTLIAIPDPFVVTDVLGAAMVTAGVIQTKIKKSRLHVEDVYKTFPKVVKELNAFRQSLEEGKFY